MNNKYELFLVTGISILLLIGFLSILKPYTKEVKITTCVAYGYETSGIFTTLVCLQEKDTVVIREYYDFK